MTCPHCKHSRSRVIDSRAQPNEPTYRRRQCLKCGERFSTAETYSAEILRLRDLESTLERLYRPRKQGE